MSAFDIDLLLKLSPVSIKHIVNLVLELTHVSIRLRSCLGIESCQC